MAAFFKSLWGIEGIVMCAGRLQFLPLSDQHRGVGDLELVLFLFVPLALCCFKWLLLSGFRNTICLPGLFISQNEWAVTKIFLPFSQESG